MSPQARKAHRRPEAASTTTPIEEHDEQQQSAESPIIDIDAHGDLVLYISHRTISTSTKHDRSFRVASTLLKAKSRYFAGLLQGRFGESAQIETRRAELVKQYGSLDHAPAAELPVVHIEDVGRISAVKSIEALLTDFLHMLHDMDTPPLPPVGNMANLAIVADRFDALEAVRAYVRRKKMLRAIDGKTTAKVDNALSEEKVRQRLLVAILLEYPPWFEKYSCRMMLKGWVDREIDEDSPLWFDLPARVEDELSYRRSCVLETMQSLQHHFLKLYSSRERQCRLGYDNSSQCDSFQLGEMIRFFSRVGFLQLRGTFLDDAEPLEPFQGDLHALIDTLRQVPEYQIDSNHSHCGIRTRLVPLLDVINECLLHVGVCQECWSSAREEHRWLDSKRPLLFKRHLLRLRAGHQELHASVKTIFTAVERDWAA